MSKRDATLHDVAQEVGVSTRTVSRVVRGEGGCSLATEQKVREAIERLGYRPNLLARGLVSGRSGTIALLGGSMTDPFFPELGEGVQQAARDHGLTMVFASTDNDPGVQSEVFDSLRSHAVDGVIVFPAPGTEAQITQMAGEGLRVIAIDHPGLRGEVPCLLSDISAGAHLAVEHLQRRGCAKIAFIGGDARPGSRRANAYRAAVDGRHGPVIETEAPDATGGVHAMERILRDHPDVDGVFAYNDLMALGAMRALVDAGRVVPDDVAVVGFDDVSVASIVSPSLTTVRVEREQLGREAVLLLNDLIAGTAGPDRSVVLPVSLVERESA